MKIIREDNEVNSAIEVMMNNFDKQNVPNLGPFWYDVEKKEVFGNVMSPCTDVNWYESPQFKCKVKTGTKLHQTIWQKNFFRGKDKRFSGDYTQVPRGRVFQFEDGFKVMTGSWIDRYPEAKEEIIFIFDLPEQNTEFVKDSHWDIGHGWSQEF